MNPQNEKMLSSKPGTGVILNGPEGRTSNLLSRAEFGDVIRNQLHELAQLGVKVLLDHPVDVDAVRAAAPDVVVLATGSLPSRPYWAPADASHVVDVLDVLRGEAHPAPGQRVVIVDELGFHQATSVAELLADRGCQVEILTPGMVVGQDLGITLDLEGFLIRAAAKGITLTPDSVVMGWNDAEHILSVLHHVSGRMIDVHADWVVLAVPATPADSLGHELSAAGFDVRRVGDVVAPRRAHAAVIDGDRLGATL